MNDLLHQAADRLPLGLRNPIKTVYLRFQRYCWRRRYVKLGRLAYLGARFRISVANGHGAFVGDQTNMDDWNIWDTTYGPIHIGTGCFLGLHNIVMGPVVIGNNVSTGPYVRILGPRHAIDGAPPASSRPTRIEDNVWISTASIIMSGVTIGENSIIGPGSVVAKDVPRNSYAAGNPARDLTQLMPFKDQIKMRNLPPQT